MGPPATWLPPPGEPAFYTMGHYLTVLLLLVIFLMLIVMYLFPRESGQPMNTWAKILLIIIVIILIIMIPVGIFF